MLWDSYLLEPLTDDADERQMMTSREFWFTQGLVFRNARFGLVPKYAIPALGEPYQDGRLLMRGLYIIIPEPTLKEKVLLRLRGKIDME